MQMYINIVRIYEERGMGEICDLMSEFLKVCSTESNLICAGDDIGHSVFIHASKFINSDTQNRQDKLSYLTRESPLTGNMFGRRDG